MTTREIVFIDGGLPDVASLLADLRPGVEAVVLRPNEDGLAQMLRALMGRTPPPQV